MKRVFTYVLFVCFLLPLAGSCKKVSVDTLYQLTVNWQERKSGLDTVPLSTAKAYAFFADAEQWEVTTIEDARAGIITKIGDPSQKRNYDEAPEGSGEYGNLFQFVFDSAPVMLVVADTKYPMWATGNSGIVPDLPNMYVTLKFRPLDWKDGDPNPIIKKPWKYYGYGNVVIPIDTRIQIVPVVWRKDEPTSSILQSTGCYAFYGLTKKNKGTVTSWENARDGIAQWIVDSTVVRKDFDVRGEWVNDSLLMKVDNPSVMVVVYNESLEETGGRKIYAYGFFDLVDNKPQVKEDVLFSLRELTSPKDTTIVYNTKWNVVYGKAPDAPENPEEPENHESRRKVGCKAGGRK